MLYTHAAKVRIARHWRVLLTLMLLPVWPRIGTALGVAAVGPSGPAAWCFVLVYVLLAAIGAAIMLLRWRRAPR